MKEKGPATRTDLPEDLVAWRRDLRVLWMRVWVAANKALALLIALAIHKVLDMAGEWLIPAGWEVCLKVFRGTFFAVFSVIYLHFLWEMLTVFVPAFKHKTWKKAQHEVAAQGT